MEMWLSDSLSEILGFPVPEDLINYILSIQNDNDLTEYMKTLLDFENPQHKNFYLEFFKKRFPSRGNSTTKQSKKKITKTKPTTEPVSYVEPPAVMEPDKKGGGKKKTKFVNLYSQEGKNAQVAMIKGRHRCECQASKHDLVNNCLQCGRIVCKQEGSGPCLYCGYLVCTPAEQKEINAKTKASAKLVEALMEKNRPRGWEAAVTHRNTLLDYDRTSERRTRVTDDDSDYFSAGSVWLSTAERGKLAQYQQSLHDKKHASRRDKRITFDFAGRQIVEDTSIDHEADQEVISNMSDATRAPQLDWFNELTAGDAPLLQFDPSVGSKLNYAGVARGSSALCDSRIQDAEMQEMIDSGKCLSMHQPWASLLVEGIKLHEGRSWYSNHRGRLWIASTAKPAEPAAVQALEQQYREMYPDKEFKFPSFYPSGCLLGCVNVDDCLPQEQYQKIHQGGESDSPYVFVCSHPVSLRLRFPIQGQHKIYTLDKTIHQAAVNCIQRMAKMQAEQANAG